jgi:hypothetical protein
MPPIVNDVTRLNPVEVFAIATPTSIEEVRDAVIRTTGPISIGGGFITGCTKRHVSAIRSTPDITS